MRVLVIFNVFLQVRAIRKKMVDNIVNNISTCDLKVVVSKLVPDSIAKDIEKICQGIYPLHDVYIRKVNKYFILLLNNLFLKF